MHSAAGPPPAPILDGRAPYPVPLACPSSHPFKQGVRMRPSSACASALPYSQPLVVALAPPFPPPRTVSFLVLPSVPEGPNADARLAAVPVSLTLAAPPPPTRRTYSSSPRSRNPIGLPLHGPLALDGRHPLKTSSEEASFLSRRASCPLRHPSREACSRDPDSLPAARLCGSKPHRGPGAAHASLLSGLDNRT